MGKRVVHPDNVRKTLIFTRFIYKIIEEIKKERGMKHDIDAVSYLILEGFEYGKNKKDNRTS